MYVSTKEITKKELISRIIFGERKSFIFPHCAIEITAQCGKMINLHSPKKIIRQIKYLVISLV